MDTAKIEKIAKNLKESNEKVATFLLDICDFLKDHEVRLQALEQLDIHLVLRIILQEINKISDVDKRNIALGCFTELLDALGIKNLEAS